ncbi:MAG: hypothetical protein ACRDHZ_00745 [Ktedonobacteraceae bacterium]
MAIPGGSGGLGNAQDSHHSYRIHVNAEVLNALIARANTMGDEEDSLPDGESAAHYLSVLDTCGAVLAAAPKTPEQCGAEQVDALLIDGLMRVVNAVAAVLPGGPREMFYYLSEEKQAAGWINGKASQSETV